MSTSNISNTGGTINPLLGDAPVSSLLGSGSSTPPVVFPSVGSPAQEPAKPQAAAPQPKFDRRQSDREPNLRLIDWNNFQPDGTMAGLHALLGNLSQLIGTDLWTGINDGGFWLYASSQPQNHRKEHFSPALRAAIEEASLERTSCLMALEDKQSSMMLQSARQELGVSFALSIGLDCKGTEFGMVLAGQANENTLGQDRLSKLLSQIRRELAVWLDVWYLCWLGAKSNSWQARFRRLYRNRKTWALGIGILIASMAIPVPYWPSRECIVEPASRRFLTSPIAGRVIEAQVRPGDLVEPGQLLARIDDEQLRWELANVEADFQKASKKADSALASRSGGDLRMAQLEREQFAIQIDSINRKLQQLEIRSPIAGVVVDGDWVPTSGTTVERAQTLFEIAPLDSMRVRTLLTTEDLGRLKVGTPVTIRVDAAEGDKWSGEVERIDPRGRLEGSEVVFEAETVVQNAQQSLRPGMRGSARLSSGWYSLGWMIFHRPYIWVMKKLAW